MIPGVDSAVPPSAASLIVAKNAGVRLWAGYFYGPNIYHPYGPKGTDLGWKRNDFTRVKETGLATLAYCSGYSDPAVMKAQSQLWDVPICLDVEGGIRGDGQWVPGWLTASGSGLYGLGPVHRGRSAPFHVVCYYPGSDPKLTWPTPAWWPRAWGAYVVKPPTAAWQWNNSHQNYGANIDSCWMDDAFAGRFSLGGGTLTGDDMDATEHSWLDDTHNKTTEIWDLLRAGTHASTNPRWIFDELESIKKQIAAMPGGSTNLQPTLDAIAKVQAKLDEHLK